MSVTYSLGFRAGGIQAGLRTTPGLDLALIVNDGPADVCLLYTSDAADE